MIDPWIARHSAHLRGAGYAENTIEDRAEVLRRAHHEMPLGLLEADVEDLSDWLARPGWCNQTRATYHGHLTGFFRWAADPAHLPHLSYDPSAGLIRPKVRRTVPRPVTDRELAHVLGRAEGRWLVYCLLAAYAGLRSCEIAAVRKEDISEEMIVVRGKGDRERAIPTHPVIWQAVRDFPRGPIARKHQHPGPATAKYVSIQTSLYLNRRLGPNEITLHRLRHWFGSTLLRDAEEGGAGTNLRVVQELLGHSNPETTAIYTLVTGRQRRRAVSALPPLAPEPC
jgi:integrase